MGCHLIALQLQLHPQGRKPHRCPRCLSLQHRIQPEEKRCSNGILGQQRAKLDAERGLPQRRHAGALKPLCQLLG
jgi:hypothetical protein